jgi:hypothetical protein
LTWHADNQSQQKMPEAGMGVASFVIAIFAVVNIVLLIIVVIAADRSSMRNDDELSPFNYLLGGWLFGAALLSVSGIVFGIGGMRQKNRRHRFALAGLCVNIGLPLLVMFVMLIGVTLMGSTGKPTPSLVDTEAWKSPQALFMQFLTLIFAGATAYYFWKRRQRVTAGFIPLPALPGIISPPVPLGCRPCPRCTKAVPVSSQFCRRCGYAMTSVPRATSNSPDAAYLQIKNAN